MDQPELPDDVKRGIYAELSQKARKEMKTKRVTEQQVLADFRAARRARR